LAGDYLFVPLSEDEADGFPNLNEENKDDEQRGYEIIEYENKKIENRWRFRGFVVFLQTKRKITTTFYDF
jgi:hypothetical protein